MANALFEKGREGFLDGTCDWDTNTIRCGLLDLDTTDTAVKAIASSTNATPIVVTTSGAHGYANGDTVVIDKHVTNTAANNVWALANVTSTTFELVGSTGNGVGGATGYAICLGPSAVGDNLDDIDGCLVGTAQTLGSMTVTAGVADAADPTFPTVTGASCEALAIWKDTGTASTSRLIAFIDGKHKVTCAATAAASAIAIAVDALTAGIPNTTTLVFSNGKSATLTSAANAGDRSLAVSALASSITVGAWASAPATASGLPVTPNGGNIGVTFDNGANKIFKL